MKRYRADIPAAGGLRNPPAALLHLNDLRDFKDLRDLNDFKDLRDLKDLKDEEICEEI